MSKKRNIIILMVVLLLTFNFINVFADSIDDLLKQQEKLDKQIKDSKSEMKKIEKETKEVSNQIRDLDNKMNKASNDLTEIEKELEELEINIEDIIEQLNQAEDMVDEKQDTFNKRLRVMYKTGPVGYLEVLLSSSSIKDFLSRQDMIKSIAKYDKELITYMKEQRDAIDGIKTELEEKHNEVILSKTKLESRRRDLASATREKERYMDRLKDNGKALEAEIDKFNEESKELGAQIVKLQSAVGEYVGGKMLWPVKGHTRISSYYGNRRHPILKVNKFHSGIDIPAPTGTNILAANNGKVIYSGALGGYGNTIMIDHFEGIVTLYGHNSKLLVPVGTIVQKGDVISKCGSTGMSTGPHLHFEVRINGVYEDPLTWLKGN